VGAHRRRLRPEKLGELRQAGGNEAVRLSLLLRLAATLNRARQDEPLPLPELLVTAAGAIDLRMPPKWLDEHPMTAADLENERGWLAEAGFALAVG
jgi:exopolyphosphatase/guanosine-5'-triphosphate,3'-diphosphate pyrophosphatase